MSTDSFIHRHIGPREEEISKMIKSIGVKSLDDLIDNTVPGNIRLNQPLNLPKGISEYEYLQRIKKIASKNKVFKSYIGTGYYNTIFPAVIQRNIFENPSWYTSYTPYQAEISQGRLEALLNFQTMISDLTCMEIANASLLDEATAAAEAMIMLYNARKKEQIKEGKCKFFVDSNIFPQILNVLETRAEPLGIEIISGCFAEVSLEKGYFGAMVQYPAGDGLVRDYAEFVSGAHANDCAVAVSADLLSLTLLTPPGEWNADIVTGSVQRFGLPMGYGGPHAAFFATKEEYKRYIPGRIIGVSKDKHGNIALRMALQTREQHIKREKATSNICTSQALLAIMAGMFAVYHGPEGLKRIALHCHQSAAELDKKLRELGFKQINENYFDTLKVELPDSLAQSDIQKKAIEMGINLRYFNDNSIGISIDETTSIDDLNKLIKVFASVILKPYSEVHKLHEKIFFEEKFLRNSNYLTLGTFSNYRSETAMMRYIKLLEKKDISLTDAMISLGSCTMKLNASVELLSLSWSEFGEMHPFVPANQAAGYQQLIGELSEMLEEITGFKAVSFQPNSGAAGEYAGIILSECGFNPGFCTWH